MSINYYHHISLRGEREGAEHELGTGKESYFTGAISSQGVDGNVKTKQKKPCRSNDEVTKCVYCK